MSSKWMMIVRADLVEGHKVASWVTNVTTLIASNVCGARVLLEHNSDMIYQVYVNLGGNDNGRVYYGTDRVAALATYHHTIDQLVSNQNIIYLDN